MKLRRAIAFVLYFLAELVDPEPAAYEVEAEAPSDVDQLLSKDYLCNWCDKIFSVVLEEGLEMGVAVTCPLCHKKGAQPYEPD